MNNKKLLVCDLDNTLYDWVSFFIPAFYALVDEVVRITACDREKLLDDFRTVHRTHHDSEYPFALLETQTITNLYRGLSRREVAKLLDPAFHAFNSSRKTHLHLYPGVSETLDALSRSGITLVAHTESNLYAVVDRLTRLDITKHFSRIYCRQRPTTDHPDPGAADDWLSRFPMHRVVELSHHQRKPNPTVLLEICADEDALPAETAYVGDSMARDILMARSTGVFAIWAKYGSSHHRASYEKLVRVTHWTDEDVAREKLLGERAKNIEPDYVLNGRFSEIIAALLPNDAKSVAVG